MADHRLLKERLRDRDPYVRRDACELIAELRSAEYIQDLVGALRDENAGVKEAALNALTSIGGGGVAEAIAPLLRLEDASLRNIGIEILEQVGTDSIETISRLLKDEDDDVVKFAVDIIANIRDGLAVDMLNGLTTHSNPNIRASVVLCLGKLGARKAVPMLLEAMKDPEEWVRFSVVEALGMLGEREALDPLLEIIQKDSLLIKEASVEAVSKIASAQDAPGILLKLEDFTRSGMVLAVSAIVELIEKALMPGSEFRPGAQFKEVYSTFLSMAVDENDRSVQEAALRGLALLRVPKTLSKVFDFAGSLKEIGEETEEFLVDIIVTVCGRELPEILKEELRKGGKNFRIIVRAIGELKSAEAIPLLKDVAAHVATHEQREILAAIEGIGSKDSVDILYDYLKSIDGHTRKISARALAKLAGPEAVPSLFEALKVEKYRDVMEEITDVISMVPSLAVKDGLCVLLTDSKELLREMGARGLGSIGDESVLESLRQATGDESPTVRKVAYTSIARLGIPGSLDAVVKGLEDTDDDVKLSVLKALSGWSGDKLRTALLKSLKEKNLWIRYHAVLLLGDIGDATLEETVMELLIKDETPVKAAAAKALEKIGTSRSIEVLERYLDHPDPNVRATVESTLETLTC